MKIIDAFKPKQQADKPSTGGNTEGQEHKSPNRYRIADQKPASNRSNTTQNRNQSGERNTQNRDNRPQGNREGGQRQGGYQGNR
ncbi:MAG: hypothetical protein LBV67_03305, partial [Streptococcaceae bacterium]|nr:hypothetical protein [Streptococcaceae bacterium]